MAPSQLAAVVSRLRALNATGGALVDDAGLAVSHVYCVETTAATATTATTTTATTTTTAAAMNHPDARSSVNAANTTVRSSASLVTRTLSLSYLALAEAVVGGELFVNMSTLRAGACPTRTSAAATVASFLHFPRWAVVALLTLAMHWAWHV